MQSAPVRVPSRGVVSCRLCGAGDLDADGIELTVPRGVHYFLRDDQLDDDTPVRLRITSCQFCGHLQSLDEPVIYGREASSATYVSGPLLAARQLQARRTFAFADAPPRSVLEIGCGDGEFLSAFRGEVNTILGIEPSPDSARRARQRGLMVEEMLLDQTSRLPDAPFDAFFAFHVLEHVPDVKSFLRGIRKNIAPRAVGCIEVPASESAYEHVRYGHFMADHLSYFFEPTLRLAVESSGFEVIELQRDWNGEHLVAYVRPRPTGSHLPVPGWVTDTTDRLASFIHQASNAGRRVAFWGASNPILPVLMHLPAGLQYIVVDKAPTKYGRRAPGSHVAILAPDALRETKIDYVVITAPRFFDEIEAELRTAFDADVETIEADVGVTNRVCRLTWHSGKRESSEV